MKKLFLLCVYGVLCIGQVCPMDMPNVGSPKDERAVQNVLTSHVYEQRKLSLDIINKTNAMFRLSYMEGGQIAVRLSDISKGSSVFLSSAEAISGTYILQSVNTGKKYQFSIKYDSDADTISISFQGKSVQQKIGDDTLLARLILQGNDLTDSTIEILMVTKERL